MLDVVFVIWAGAAFGGMERRYVRLADFLSKEHPEKRVSILARAQSVQTVESFLSPDSHVKVVPYGIGERKIGRFLSAFVDIIGLIFSIFGSRSAHIHICGNPGPVSTMVGLSILGRKSKSISMVDLTFGLDVNIVKVLYAKVSTRIYARIDCLSQETKRILKEIVGVEYDRKMRVAPCSFTDFSKIYSERPRDIDIAMIARFVEHKGFDLLESIEDEVQYLNVHICGFGPLKLNFRHFSIYRTKDPLSVLNRSKVFLSLQATNNYPSQSTLEAMASGCAIIATDVGETRKFLDEECAILIPYNADALRSAIEQLMKDSNLRHRLGQRAKERVLQEHTIERYAHYFMDEILDLNHPHNHRS